MTVQAALDANLMRRASCPLDRLVQIVPAQPADTAAVLEMMARCSRSTLFHRFHGYTDGVGYTRGVLSGRPGHQTLVAWRNGSCVGLASLSIDAGGLTHLAALVEDAWQCRGVGTWLVRALLDAARAIGIASVHADILGEDDFILSLLRRIGPLKVSFDMGTFSVDVDLLSPAGGPLESTPFRESG